MIDEIINDIKTAEDKAEQIMQDSYLKGREIVLNAEKQADQRIKSSIKTIKTKAESDERELEVQLEKSKKDKIEEAKAKAENRYQENLLKIDSYANKVVERFINRS